MEKPPPLGLMGLPIGPAATYSAGAAAPFSLPLRRYLVRSRFVRYTAASLVAAALFSGVMPAAQDKEPPDKLVFPSKAGDVTFLHAAHAAREKGACSTCHQKLWPQSAAEPLKNSDGCKTCHGAGGKAFEMKGNCAKCHPSGSAKAG